MISRLLGIICALSLIMFTCLIPLLALGQGGSESFLSTNPALTPERFTPSLIPKSFPSQNFRFDPYFYRLYEYPTTATPRWTIPSYLSDSQREEVAALLKKLREICPHCAQVPSDFTDPFEPVEPGIGSYSPSRTWLELRNRLKNKELDDCTIPEWLESALQKLEQRVAQSSVTPSDSITNRQLRVCKRQHFLDLLGAIGIGQ